jgi:hypothetical protein
LDSDHYKYISTGLKCIRIRVLIYSCTMDSDFIRRYH